MNEQRGIEAIGWLTGESRRCKLPPEEELLVHVHPSPVEGLALLRRVKMQLEEDGRALRKRLRPALSLIHKEEDPTARLLMRETVKMSGTGTRLRQVKERLRALRRTEYRARRLYGIDEGQAPGILSDARIQEAREAPILDVVSTCIEVRKAGKSHSARCPFHHDTNPSLHIYPEQNRYHCYGCGKGGDVIDFVMSYLKCGFKEAVIYLNGGTPSEKRSTGS